MSGRKHEEPLQQVALEFGFALDGWQASTQGPDRIISQHWGFFKTVQVARAAPTLGCEPPAYQPENLVIW